MAKNARFQRYQEHVRSGARRLRDRLIRIGTMGITWVRRWGSVIFQATRNEVQRATNCLRRHPSLYQVGIGLIVFILILWILPKWQVSGATLTDKEHLELIDKARGTPAQILAGAGVAAGLYVTWRRVAAAERTVQWQKKGR